MTREDVKKSIAAYCLGALEPAEHEAVEAFIQQGDSEIIDLIKEMRLVVTGLSLSAPSTVPPPALKDNLMSAIRSQAKPIAEAPRFEARVDSAIIDVLRQAKKRWMHLSWGLAAALLMVAFGLGWYAQVLQDRLSALNDQLSDQEAQVQSLTIELTELRKLRSFINSPQIRMVSLDGLEVSPNSTANVFWDRDQKQLLFHGFRLPQAAADQDYQLWLLPQKGQPIDAGIFTVNAAGFAEHNITTTETQLDLAGFAVTLEPKGGAPQPSGDMYLYGKIEAI